MTIVQDRISFLEFIRFALPIQNPFCVEIGVLEGNFSRMILEELTPKWLALIDPYMKSEDRYGGVELEMSTAYSDSNGYRDLINRFAGAMQSGTVQVLREFSHNIVSVFADKFLHFLYIDGNHKYESVKKDLNDWLPKMQENSVIAGHDYIDHPDFGVKQAVNEFMEEHGWEMIIHNSNGGDFALKKIQ